MPIYDNTEYIKIMRPLPQFVDRDVYDIPFIEVDPIDITYMNNGIWIINMKNVSKKDKHPNNKIVHSFCYDNALRRNFNNPIKYLQRVSKYYAISSFDFSMDIKMDFKQILSAIYDNRWSGAFFQVNGKMVIPTVGWLKKDTYDICFAGLRDGGVFIISTLGVINKVSLNVFLDGYYEMRKRFPNTKILCVGNPVVGMDNDVCYVFYKDSFGNWDNYQEYWQPSFINWDGSIAEWREL